MKLIRNLLLPLFALGLTAATPAPSQAQLGDGGGGGGGTPCLLASMAYCEFCWCWADPKGTGGQCYRDIRGRGPSGELCQICFAHSYCERKVGRIGFGF